MFDIKGIYSSFIGETHEVAESVHEAVSEKVQSPFYGYFFISWIIINWDYVYTALFVDSEYIFEKTGLLKNEYLLQVVLPPHYLSTLYWWNFLFYPLILSVFAMWVLPYVVRAFYTKHLRNKIRMEEIRLRETAIEVRAKTEVIEAEAKETQARTELLEAEVENAAIKEKVQRVSPEVAWRKDYTEFELHPLFVKFQNLIDCVYEHNGYTKLSIYNGNSTNFTLDQEMFVYADANGLIKSNSTNGRITLTDKGRAFVKYFISSTKKK